MRLESCFLSAKRADLLPLQEPRARIFLNAWSYSGGKISTRLGHRRGEDTATIRPAGLNTAPTERPGGRNVRHIVQHTEVGMVVEMNAGQELETYLEIF